MISALVVGRDQGLTLGACLASLVDFDDVVYCDGGSVDESRDIALAHAARIFDCRGLGGGPARNLGASHCLNDWVLWLSPDDVLQPGGLAALREVAKTATSDGINVTVREHRYPDHSFMFPRVFRRGTMWKGRAHEHLDGNPADNAQDVVVTHMRGPWHDNPSDPAAVANALMQDIADDPHNPRWYYYLAREYYYLGQLNLAIPVFEQRCSMVGYVPELADAFLYLAHCRWALNQGDQARSACLTALGINANFKEAALFMAEIVYHDNKEQWLRMAATATNASVLFVRK